MAPVGKCTTLAGPTSPPLCHGTLVDMSKSRTVHFERPGMSVAVAACGRLNCSNLRR